MANVFFIINAKSNSLTDKLYLNQYVSCNQNTLATYSTQEYLLLAN